MKPKRFRCSECHGNGKKSKTFICGKCHGKKWVTGFFGGENTCSRCEGSGEVEGTDGECGTCNGKGYVVKMVDDVYDKPDDGPKPEYDREGYRIN